MALLDILRSALGTPREHEALARSLSGPLRAEEVVSFGSGTQALTTAISLAAARSPGPRSRVSSIVALPAYSCFDVVTAAVGSGVRVTFFDLDPETLAPDRTSLEAALRAGASVIVVSPLFGYPVPWRSLLESATSHGATVVEDAAQGGGGRWEGRLIGSLAELSVVSFGRGKGWGGGGGGALLARGAGTAAVRSVRPASSSPGPGSAASVLARSLAQWLLGRPGLYGIPDRVPMLRLGETVYREPEEPRRAHAYQERLALRSFAASLHEGKTRREVVARYLAELGRSGPSGSSEGSVTPVRPVQGAEPGYLRFPILLRGGHAPITATQEARRLGLRGGYPVALPRLRQLGDRVVDPEREYPGARQLADELMTLPTHRFMTPRVVGAVLHLLNRHSKQGP